MPGNKPEAASLNSGAAFCCTLTALMPAAATSRNTLYRLLPDWLIGAFCLAIPALYNSFPLVTSDSGAYISNAYLLQVPLDRPLGYSIFIRIVTTGTSLWSVVLAQTLLVSVLLLLIARHALGAAYHRNIFTAMMLLTGVATSAGWFAGQIMPDIFTAILLLAICILCAVNVSSRARWGLYLLLLICILTHNSNLLIALAMGLVILIIAVRKKDALLRRVGVALLTASVSGWITLSSLNAAAGHGFRPSAASHVFIMCRMVEDGIMDAFLHDQCPTEPDAYKLCAFKDQLPNRQWEFMWAPNSPLYATGGWEANEEEYSRIIRKTLTSPKYLGMHVIQNVQGSFRELPLIYVGDGLQPFDENSSPYKAIAQYHRHQLKEFTVAMQQVSGLHFEWWNTSITLFGLLVITGGLILSRKRASAKGSYDPLHRITWISIIFLIVNAIITVTFATVIGRYEARVFWILPFLSILYILRSYYTRDEQRVA